MQRVGQRLPIEWDASERVMVVDYAPVGALTEEIAAELVAASRSLLGDDRRMVRFLFRCEGVREVTPAHRARVAEFFRDHRDCTALACVGLTPMLRVMATLFGKATGVPIQAFEDEATARAWLRSRQEER